MHRVYCFLMMLLSFSHAMDDSHVTDTPRRPYAYIDESSPVPSFQTQEMLECLSTTLLSTTTLSIKAGKDKTLFSELIGKISELDINTHLRFLKEYVDNQESLTCDVVAAIYSAFKTTKAISLWMLIIKDWEEKEKINVKILNILTLSWKRKKVNVVGLARIGLHYYQIFNGPFSRFFLTLDDEDENLSPIFNEVLKGGKGKTLILRLVKESDRDALPLKHREFFETPSMFSSLQLIFSRRAELSLKNADSQYFCHVMNALRSNANLHKLCLSTMYPNGEAKKALADLFKTNKQIASIDFDTISTKLSEFFSVLKTYEFLQKISLTAVELGKTDEDNLIFHMITNKNLTDICLGEMNLNDTILRGVIRVIKENSKLKKLWLFGVAEEEDLIEEFAQALATNQSVKVLQLLTFNDNGKGASILLTALKQNQHLQHFGLDSDCSLNQDIRLVNEFIKTTSTLKSLCLDESIFTQANLESFKEALIENTSLTEITINNLNLDNDPMNLQSIGTLKPSLRLTDKWKQ